MHACPQMRVMLNASALSGVIIFALFNIFGMNLGDAPDRLAGVHGFAGSSFMGKALFDTVRAEAPDFWSTDLQPLQASLSLMQHCLLRAGHRPHCCSGCAGVLCIPHLPTLCQPGALQHHTLMEAQICCSTSGRLF